MGSYFLLRNNEEFGPFTLKELNSFGVNLTDLIWVESESNVWNYPTEITGLKVTAQNGLKNSLPASLKTSHKIDTPVSGYTSGTSEAENANSYPHDSVNFYSSKKYSKKKHRHKVYKGAGFFGFIFLLIVVGFCAFVVKRMLDGFNIDEFSPTAEAKTIEEELLYPSITAHSARITNADTKAQTISDAFATKKDTTQRKPIVAKAVVPKKVTKAIVLPSTVVDVSSGNNNAPIVGNTEEELVENPKEEIQPTNPPPSLQVSANDYSVGLFGGISNLELSITNPSSQSIEKVTVEVEFLKPNGKVVKSQTVSAENISPGSSKRIVVPSSNRGVKIRYTVVSMQPVTN